MEHHRSEENEGLPWAQGGSKHAATGIGASLPQPEALSCLFGGTVLLVLDAAVATIQWSPDYTCFCLAELLVLYTIGGLPYKPLLASSH